MTLTQFASSAVVLGFLEAAPLVLAAMGFTLIYCLNGFTNVGYAESLTLGAYFAVIFNAMLGLDFYVSLIPAAILSGIVSVLTYLLLFRPAFRRGVGKTELIIMSVGLSYFLRYGARLIFGGDLYNFNFDNISYLSILGIGVTDIQIICVVLVVIIALGIYLFMYKTSYGEQMRALADNEELAGVTGIDPTRVTVLIWFIAGVSGGLAGAFYGAFSYVNVSLGWNQILIIIMITIVGGIGSVRSALIASVFAGIITSTITLFSQQLYGQVVLLLGFILILRLRKGKM